jgi:putative transposase
MPQSLVKNYIHLIFSTKHRVHSVDEEIQPQVFRYIAGICAHNDCYPVRIGGYTNHVHALFLLSKKMLLVKIVEEIKSHSSSWMKKQGERYKNFYWQSGYGAFSVNPSEVDIVRLYKQSKEHHSRKTFEEEYRACLKKYHVEYNEEYVWD